MIRPGVFIRVTGNRVSGALLMSLSVWVMLGWWKGFFPWLAALMASAVCVRCSRSMGQMTRYRKWEKEWTHLNEPVFAEESREDLPEHWLSDRRKRRRSLVVSWVVLFAVPVFDLFIYSLPNHDDYTQSVGIFTLTWCFACVYLVYRFIRRMVKGKELPASSVGSIGAGTSSSAGEKDEPVSWLVGTASFAPARSDAMRALPDYCMRLLYNSTGTLIGRP